MRQSLPLFLLFAACAPHSGGDDPFEARDPFRPVNEKVFAFNLEADRYVVGPVAHQYRKLPAGVRGTADNFLTNLSEPLNAVDGALAGNPKIAFTSIWRFLLNTSFGFLGLRDFAGENGLPLQQIDFGKTLGVWGVGQGPYLVLPIVGPSTVRDASGQAGDWFLDPVGWYLNRPQSIAELMADGLDTRDEQDDAIEETYYHSFDPYAAVRATYLQHQDMLGSSFAIRPPERPRAARPDTE